MALIKEMAIDNFFGKMKIFGNFFDIQMVIVQRVRVQSNFELFQLDVAYGEVSSTAVKVSDI